MTLLQLSNPSTSYVDIRDYAGQSSFTREQRESEGNQAFFALLKAAPHRDRTSDTKAASFRADTAQESSGAAQDMPKQRDSSDAAASAGVEVEENSEAARDKGESSAVDPAARIRSIEQFDERDTTQAIDGSARTDHPDELAVVEPVDDESIHREPADDEAVEDDSGPAAQAPVRTLDLDAKTAASSDTPNHEDGDEDDDAAPRTAEQRNERGQRFETDRRNGTSDIHPAEPRTAPPAAKHSAASAVSERGIEHHQVSSAAEQSRLRSANPTDESAPPAHLEKSANAGHERRAEQREPMVLDQRDQREHRVMPAAARAVQVESQVRLENASGQSGATDISARIALAAQGGSNSASFTGEQNGQNLPGHGLGNAERATPDDARFSGRVIRGLTAMINQRGGTMTMRLDPPDLGQLRIQMTLARGTVAASFFAQSNQARALLEKNMAALRAALENHGLTVERLNVQSSQPSSQQGHLMNEENAQRQHDHQRHNAAEGESRGRRDDRGEDGNDRQSSGEFADVIEQLEQTKHIRH